MKARKRQRTRGEPWVGAWLRESRKDRGIDMEAVMRRLRRSKAAVSRIETGKATIPSDDLPTMLRAYWLTVDDFASAVKASA